MSFWVWCCSGGCVVVLVVAAVVGGRGAEIKQDMVYMVGMGRKIGCLKTGKGGGKGSSLEGKKSRVQGKSVFVSMAWEVIIA